MKKSEKKIKIFLAELKSIPVIERACKICGLSRNTIYRWRNEDEDFRQKMDKSIEIGERNIDDLTSAKYFSLINKEYWPAIKYRLMHSPTKKEFSMLERLDKQTEEYKKLLEFWQIHYNDDKKEDKDI